MMDHQYGENGLSLLLKQVRDRSVFMVGTGPEICQMVEQKKSLSRMENMSKILVSRTDHKLTLEKTNMFHYMQKTWNQRGISVES